MTAYIDDDEYENQHRYRFDPIDLPPEIYADLDLQVLSDNAGERHAAINLGTALVAERFEHLAQPTSWPL